MYTSDIDMNAKRASKSALVYLLISLFFILFGAIYEVYSHEVYSYYMLYAFMFPLVGGTLPFCILSLIKIKKYPNAVAQKLYYFGIVTLTIGSIVRGVLDIYGTTNLLSKYYWWIGFLLVFAGIVIGVIDWIFPREIKMK